MTLKESTDRIDDEELDYQMAYDLVEADEQQARRQGVKTPDEVRAMPSSQWISAKDPDWFKKLSKVHGLA